jgi:energy-coupling factor transport system substrate-specific component
MESTNIKSQKMKRMDIRDYITVAILMVLGFLIYSVVGIPTGLLPQTLLFTWALCAIPWGIIFMLLYTRVNKKNVMLSWGALQAIILLMSFWFPSILVFTGAILAEIIWQKSDRKKFIVMMTCFTIQITFWYLATPLMLLFLKEQFFAAMPMVADHYAQVYNYVLTPLFPLSLLATIGGCIAGAFLGKAVLKKHFEKAGIV